MTEESSPSARKIDVLPVSTKRQQKQFIDFAWKHYRENKYWIPPLRLNHKELLNYKPHPFYQHAEIQTFLAWADGELVGRIAAIDNHAHLQRHEDGRGFFGFFETIDDPRVAEELLQTAGDWLRERGRQIIQGPVNPSLNYETGTLVDGFDDSPQFMMTYNFPYYDALIQGCGFQTAQNLYAFYGHADMLADVDHGKFAFLVKEVEERMKVTFRPMNKKNFAEEVRLFLDIYNRSMINHWGFVPFSPEEVEHSANGLKHLVVSELSWIAEVDGKAIGCVFGIPDYNPRIKQIDGRLWPFGFFRLLWNRRGIPRTRLVSTTVVPEYQRWGVGAVILAKMLPDGLEYGLTECEFSWVAESNDLSFKSLKRGGARVSKTYRVYEKEL